MWLSKPLTRPLRFSPRRSRHLVDEVPPLPRLITLGIQHLVIMYAGAVAVPLIVGDALGLPTSTVALLVSADLLVCGIFTVIQAVGIGKILGVRLPVVTGATFTVLTPMIIIAQQYGMQAVYGAMIVSGVFGVLDRQAVLDVDSLLSAAGRGHRDHDHRAVADRRGREPDRGPRSDRAGLRRSARHHVGRDRRPAHRPHHPVLPRALSARSPCCSQS